MIKDHYLFITIAAFFAMLLVGLTFTGIEEITGYYTKDTSFCEPLTCKERGLVPAGEFYCSKFTNKCYRHCYQNGVLIEKATFCEKGSA